MISTKTRLFTERVSWGQIRQVPRRLYPSVSKFYEDVECLESSIQWTSFQTSLTMLICWTKRRELLEDRSKELKEVITLDKLDEMKKSELCTNMKKSNATARMQDLFSSYMTTLSCHGLKWIITENQNISVQNVLSAIRPALLKDRLESGLSFSHHLLKKIPKDFSSTTFVWQRRPEL